MKKITFTIGLITLLILGGCNQKKSSDKNSETKITSQSAEDTVNSTVTDKNGKKLDMSFSNSEDIVIITFEGKTAELQNQKPASGIWYKNDIYELRGKGDEIELSENEIIIFTTVKDH